MSSMRPFRLERFFAKYEFTAPWLACCSDCEPLTMTELLDMADDDAQQHWRDLRLGYTETQGLPELRQAIAQTYFQHVPANNLVILVPEEGVYLSMRALLRPGDHLVVTYPGYQSLFEIATSMGCSVSRWEPRLGEDASVDFDMQDLQGLVTATTRMVVVNFPHNPTGALLSHVAWQQLVELCKQHDCWLFSDEMYRMLELAPASRLPCAADCYSKAISLGGCSKALALPGLRMGWIACQDQPFLTRLLEMKDYTTICSSAPSEVLALIAVRATQQIVNRNLQLIKDNVAAFEACVQEFPHVLAWQPPPASSIAYPRLLIGADVDAWCDQLVSETGVLLLPGTVYEHDPSTRQARFRLGLGRRNLPQCLDLLKQHVSQYAPKVSTAG